MKKIYNEIIDEELFYEKMKNGLEVYYIPKKGFLNKYAVLGVDFGSNDLEFIPIGEDTEMGTDVFIFMYENLLVSVMYTYIYFPVLSARMIHKQ